MPEKYHIETRPVPPRRPRIGKYGIVDWREDCARCHNCVKKACVYDRYREEANYIRKLDEVDTLFFDCMGCFSCVQECTKNLLRLSINPEYEKLGNSHWKPEIIQTTWVQAETAKIPVSGAGYGGAFSGHGFDSMWTDMSEIVRPTARRHPRPRVYQHRGGYRAQAVVPEIGKGQLATDMPPILSVPMPLLIDMMPAAFVRLPKPDAMIARHRRPTPLHRAFRFDQMAAPRRLRKIPAVPRVLFFRRRETPAGGGHQEDALCRDRRTRVTSKKGSPS
jgi:ferredoxin